MVEYENLEACSEIVEEKDEQKGGFFDFFWAPIDWFKMLANETHWSFVFGVLSVYGVNQGLGGAFNRVGTDYYMKDVQKVQPSESQVYQGITAIPWLVKPLWGLLTDVIPIFGYRRRPYFIFAGLLGVVSMLLLSFHENLHIVFALLSLTAGSASAAIADVTIDACVAQNSNTRPSLAADMQSLCAFSSSIGALMGFSLSGIFVHLIGPKGVFGLLSIPAGLVLLVGILLDEPFLPDFSYRQVKQKFVDAGKAMWRTLKFPDVWRPCIYMYLSLAMSVNIHEGLFYWYTDSKGGPSFSQCLSDDCKAKVDASSCAQFQALPPGIEGTFFALLMSIDNVGLLSSQWAGGIVLHFLNVTRTRFDNLWLAIITRNILRVTPLFLLFLIPRGDPNASILPTEILGEKQTAETPENKNIELVSLVSSDDGK
ncbi:unnamed protein product [Dovyalis caffra]|uniref:Folate-biopterin transporter 2 n=1 Tax=Dovyalis caffra TaxID=77055 RepID=A0AAV1SM85_9ROSI|nr:unnamed protein product [Dovyalis caffra]